MKGTRFRKEHWQELVAHTAAGGKPNQDTASDTSEPTVAPSSAVRDLYRRYFQAYRYGWLAASLAVLAICLVASGSRSAGRPGRVSVCGRVLLDGQPVASGSINFYPAEGHAGPAANTGISNGRYQFSREDGPFVGPHHVVVAFLRDAADEAQFARSTKVRQSSAVPESAGGGAGSKSGGSDSPQAVAAGRSHTREFDLEVPATAAPRLDLEISE
ncbi:MAG: hypothetical protein NTY19_05335 [Planctomycetota bacterium]|nr:hypothetical protein [Planctomycetota bacterium]